MVVAAAVAVAVVVVVAMLVVVVVGRLAIVVLVLVLVLVVVVVVVIVHELAHLGLGVNAKRATCNTTKVFAGSALQGPCVPWPTRTLRTPVEDPT